MLSGHSFNALLKTLEEPPEHVKFLLATTDPQKLPVTVLSRCLQFTLRHISSEQIAAQLEKILSAEGITSESTALIQLADSADGSMRDALSLMDQAIAYSGGNVTEQTVSQMLGTVPSEQVDALIDAICEFDPASAMKIVHSLTILNIDFSKLLDQLIVIFHASAISQAVPDYTEQLVMFKQSVSKVCDKVAPEDIQLFYQIVLSSRKDLYLAHSPRAGFEMAVLRMIMFKPATEGKAPHAKRVATRSNHVNKGKASAAVADALESAPAQQKTVSQADVQKPVVNEVAAPTVKENVQEAVSEAPAPIVNTTRPQSVDAQQWLSKIEQADMSGVVKALATHCALRHHENNEISLMLSQEHESLMAGATVEKLTQKLQESFGEDTKVDIKVVEQAIDSPAQKTRDREAERLSQTQSSLEDDDFIQALKRDMQAEIVPGSIKTKQEGEQ